MFKRKSALEEQIKTELSEETRKELEGLDCKTLHSLIRHREEIVFLPYSGAPMRSKAHVGKLSGLAELILMDRADKVNRADSKKKAEEDEKAKLKALAKELKELGYL